MSLRVQGVRPKYFRDPQVDRLYPIIVALAEEVSVLRERLDTHERLADSGALASRDEVEQYRIDETAGTERDRDRRAFIERVFRVIYQEAEIFAPGSSPAEDYERVVQGVSEA